MGRVNRGLYYKLCSTRNQESVLTLEREGVLGYVKSPFKQWDV